jgi:hypothetical protein
MTTEARRNLCTRGNPPTLEVTAGRVLSGATNASEHAREAVLRAPPASAARHPDVSADRGDHTVLDEDGAAAHRPARDRVHEAAADGDGAGAAGRHQ